MPYLSLYLMAGLVVGCGGMLAGAVLRWWGLLAPVGFACFLAYAWEFTPAGVSYAAIAGILGCIAVSAGAFVRRAFR